VAGVGAVVGGVGCGVALTSGLGGGEALGVTDGKATGVTVGVKVVTGGVGSAVTPGGLVGAPVGASVALGNTVGVELDGEGVGVMSGASLSVGKGEMLGDGAPTGPCRENGSSQAASAQISSATATNRPPRSSALCASPLSTFFAPLPQVVQPYVPLKPKVIP